MVLFFMFSPSMYIYGQVQPLIVKKVRVNPNRANSDAKLSLMIDLHATYVVQF